MTEAEAAELYRREAGELLRPDAWIWMVIWPVAYALLTGVLLALLFWLSSRRLRKLRRSQESPAWYLEAREAALVRKGVGLSATMLPLFGAWIGFKFEWPATTLMSWLIALLALLSSSLVANEVNRRSEGWVTGRLRSRRRWWRDRMVYLLLFGAHIPIFLLALVAMPTRWGAGAMVVIAIAAFLWWLVVHRGASIWLLERLWLMRPADERLSRIADRATEDTGISARVCEIDWSTPNAVAIDRGTIVAMTSGGMEVFEDDEAHAVLCHEVGHVADFPEMRRQRIVRSWCFFPIITMRLVVTQFGLTGMFVLLASILFLANRFLKAQRNWEFRADEEAAGEERERVYAGALEKMYRHMLIPAVVSKKPAGTHPDLYDRLEKIGSKPDYGRPLPPGKFLSGLIVLLVVVFAIIFGKRMEAIKAVTGASPEGKAWVLPTLFDRSGWKRSIILAEGRGFRERGELDQAAKCLRAAALMWPRHWREFVEAAEVSLEAGQRDDAAQYAEWAWSEYYYEVDDSRMPPEIQALNKRLGR